jgi:hypothetical protein
LRVRGCDRREGPRAGVLLEETPIWRLMPASHGE